MAKKATQKINGKVVKDSFFEKMESNESIARTTSSVKQGFSRIRDIIDCGEFLKIMLVPTADDPSQERTLSYGQAFGRLNAMRRMAPIVNLEDAKAFFEVITLLEARLQEAANKRGFMLTDKGFIKL